jgi:hypothetical protein
VGFLVQLSLHFEALCGKNDDDISLSTIFVATTLSTAQIAASRGQNPATSYRKRQKPKLAGGGPFNVRTIIAEPH